jgi:DNA-binding NarL/FixJ family response regulator
MAHRRTLLIIDDHPFFREGIKAIIGPDRRFEVIGETGNGRAGLKMAQQLRPNLIIMDISLPDQSGIKLTRELKELLPDTKTMIVSMHSRIDYITEAFQAGARGYVVKESAAESLLEGLDSVAKGGYFLDSTLSGEVVENLMGLPIKMPMKKNSGYETLTPREQEILSLLAEGLPSAEIAEKLFISPKTVKNHRANIMQKLDLHNTMDLVRYAVKLGLIDINLWQNATPQREAK